MNQPTPAPSREKTSDQKAARRNYLLFVGASGICLFVLVLVASLFAAS